MRTKTTPLILYAEDDGDDILHLHELFADQSDRAELITVKDGLEALDFLRRSSASRPPALVVLDINMPKLDGRETLVRMRAISGFEQTPVVLLTTSSFDLHPSFAKRYGARFMNKPLRDYQLTALLDMLPAVPSLLDE